MSRIEEALRRAQQSESGVEQVTELSRFTDIESVADAPPAPFLDAELPVVTAPRVAVADVPVVTAPRVAVVDVPVVTAPRVAVADVPARAPAPARVAVAEMPARAPAHAPVHAPVSTPMPEREHHRVINEKLVTSPDVNRGVVEQYRKLAAALHQLQVERGTKIVMIASAMAGEGKTLTAANVALTLSESFHRRTLLIDADLRRPTVHSMFNITAVPGLNDVLSASEDRKLNIVEVSPRLSILPAGRPNPDPMSGLTSERMRTITQEAASRFDWVVLDTPPIDLLPDASLLAEMVDVALLVVSAGRTPLKSVERAVNVIDRKRIVGVVLNRAASQSGGGYYSYYGTAVVN